MTYRPYPNADRARHQIERHDDETPPLSDGSRQPPSLFGQRLLISEEAQAAMGASLAKVGASLRAAFQPRPAGSEETSG
jgi:hypothetical protein